MARIVIVTHEYDEFLQRTHFWKPAIGNYLLYDVLKLIERRGHRWRVSSGLRPMRGDVGWLHVDSTRIEPEYVALAAHYSRTINFGAHDISKRRVSRMLLARDDIWSGPVMIKSDLNHMGWPEVHHNSRALKANRTPPHPGAVPADGYVILPSIDEVSDAVWNDATKVVERFLPELDDQGYATRSWVFMGKAERCSRHVGREPIVKSGNSTSRTAVAVPDALRLERARLGFDYGKFDFVVHDGEPILLDANRTPGMPQPTGGVPSARAELLAKGLEELLK